MKNILYATDYSDNSVTALKYAYDLSLKLAAKLEVIHVFSYPKVLADEVNDEPLSFEPNPFIRNRNRLLEFCERHLDKNLENVNIDAVENNSVVEGILAKAKDLDPLFIVVGSKGISGLRDFIMGNTTKRLIEKAAYTMLSIPSGEEVRDIKTIIYATAFENDDIHAICKLIEIAKPLNAEIKVVHISTKREYQGEVQMEWFKEMLENKIDYGKISFELIFDDDIFNSLLSFTDQNNADLIAMLERNNNVGFLSRISNKNKIRKMHDYGKYPLISFNKKKCLTLDLS